jgi:hypothetical protein
MYTITQYTKDKADKLGLTVKPSTLKHKKIDVFKDNKKIASIGALGMSDYPTYLLTKGKAYADERKRLYHLRHTKNSLGEELARKLLWT